MERRPFHTESLEERLADEAKLLREETKMLPPGAVRDATIRAAMQAEIGAHISEWLSLPGLKAPT